MRKAFLLAALAALAPLQAAATDKLKLTSEARELIAEFVREDRHDTELETLAERARDAILSLDMDGGGLSRLDLETKQKLAIADHRAREMGRYTRMDLNGDGKASREEYRVVVRQKFADLEHILEDNARREGKAPDYSKWFSGYPVVESHAEFSGIMAMYDAVDTDRDGAISLQEGFEATAKHNQAQEDQLTKAYRYLALDLNRDGNVTPAEIDRAVAAFKRDYKAAEVWETTPPTQHPQRYGGLVIEDQPERGMAGVSRSCAFPKPSDRALLVRVGIYQGTRLSNVAMAGQNRPTGVAVIEIEPGKTPLYIVASQFAPTVWQFTGAVERIERLVVASHSNDAFGRPAIGVTGLSASKVTGTRKACVGDLWSKVADAKASEAGKLMEQHFGRLPDVMHGGYDAAGIRLPGATQFKLPTNRPQALRPRADSDIEFVWRDLERYHPGGIAEIDPRRVIAWTRPEPYETLPMEAGLVQLMVEGKIARLEYGDFVVQRLMRFPPGLHGGHSGKFIVLKGVPPPLGDPGHSCVIFEDPAEATGAVRGCRR